MDLWAIRRAAVIMAWVMPIVHVASFSGLTDAVERVLTISNEQKNVLGFAVRGGFPHDPVGDGLSVAVIGENTCVLSRLFEKKKKEII